MQGNACGYCFDQVAHWQQQQPAREAFAPPPGELRVLADGLLDARHVTQFSALLVGVQGCDFAG
jgi:hypothetical protein